MDCNTIDVSPRSYGFGTTRWTERLFLDVKEKGEAFFGRMVGLYDYCTGLKTDIDSLEDVHRRLNMFRTINIWIDNAPKSVRNAHYRIRGDFPGIGKVDVSELDFDIQAVKKWAAYEKQAIDASARLHALYQEVWDNDFVQMGIDLHMSVKSLNLIRKWAEIPSYECRRIIRSVDGLTDKEEIMEKWEETERQLLSVPAPKRKEENFG